MTRTCYSVILFFNPLGMPGTKQQTPAFTTEQSSHEFL